MSRPAGVALAAGAGTRLRPLTLQRPKALCPVDNIALLDRAVGLLRAHVHDIAVNAHHHAEQIAAHVGDDLHVSIEQAQALGTAGALGQLRNWIDGRDVLLVNADAYLTADVPGDDDLGDHHDHHDHTDPAASGSRRAAMAMPVTALDALVDGWDGRRCRLLTVPVVDDGDFMDGTTPVRYVGACLLPWELVGGLPAAPAGLYELLWRHERAAGRLDLVRFDGTAIDCGTPADYLRANLHASGGRSVVGDAAVVEGTIERSVVLPGAYVGPDEHLTECIRAGTHEHPLTVPAPLTGTGPPS